MADAGDAGVKRESSPDDRDEQPRVYAAAPRPEPVGQQRGDREEPVARTDVGGVAQGRGDEAGADHLTQAGRGEECGAQVAGKERSCGAGRPDPVLDGGDDEREEPEPGEELPGAETQNALAKSTRTGSWASWWRLVLRSSRSCLATVALDVCSTQVVTNRTTR